jgi:hypothetical protein
MSFNTHLIWRKFGDNKLFVPLYNVVDVVTEQESIMLIYTWGIENPQKDKIYKIRLGGPANNSKETGVIVEDQTSDQKFSEIFFVKTKTYILQLKTKLNSSQYIMNANYREEIIFPEYSTATKPETGIILSASASKPINQNQFTFTHGGILTFTLMTTYPCTLASGSVSLSGS